MGLILVGSGLPRGRTSGGGADTGGGILFRVAASYDLCLRKETEHRWN